MIHFIKKLDLDLGLRQRAIQYRAVAAITADTDDLLPFQVFPAHAPALGKRMIAATCKDKWILDKRREDDFRM